MAVVTAGVHNARYFGDTCSFAWQQVVPIRYAVTLTDPEDIRALFSMTPYAWKTPREGIQRLENLSHLETEIGFDIHVYQRIK